MSKILVTVCFISYNQKKYIRESLEGIVKQKTTFPFEVLVHDDASTDGTVEIIKEYETKYPDLFKVIYEEENQYSKDPNIWLNFQFPYAQGEYLAFCEGDDYWTDEYKLQKQYEAMENNPACSMCVHNIRKINEDGSYRKEIFPPIFVTPGIITADKYIHEELGRGKWLFQTSSFFVKTCYMKEWIENTPEFVKKSRAGDIVVLLYSLLKGDVIYIDNEMSNYRLDSSGSVGSKLSVSKEFRKNQMGRYIEVMQLFDEFSEYRFHEDVQKYIQRREFAYYIDAECYKEAKNKKYKEYYNEMSFFKRIYVTVGSYSKRLVDIMDFFRRLF